MKKLLIVLAIVVSLAVPCFAQEQAAGITGYVLPTYVRAKTLGELQEKVRGKIAYFYCRVPIESPPVLLPVNADNPTNLYLVQTLLCWSSN